MITREQVKDLQPGDVVELRDPSFPEVVLRGPVRVSGDDLMVSTFAILRQSGGVPFSAPWDLTVVSRAPRPLYVNHPRPEPVLGDVVRDGKGEVRHALPPKTAPFTDRTYRATEPRWWASVGEYDGEWLHCSTDYMPRPLTLLVDGETGQVVQ